MATEHEKGILELSIFKEFAKKADLKVLNGSAKKSDPNQGKPDIFCVIGAEPVYFELTEACAPEFAAASNGSKRTDIITVWGNDVSEETVKKKLQKTYQINQAVELLVYTNGRTGLSDEVIATKIQEVLNHGHGQFRRIWLFGDIIMQLYPTTE